MLRMKEMSSKMGGLYTVRKRIYTMSMQMACQVSSCFSVSGHEDKKELLARTDELEEIFVTHISFFTLSLGYVLLHSTLFL
jgi:hypothetical protein